VSSKNLSHADLYVSGPPTYFGKTTRGIMRFVKKLELPPGTKYAVLGTFSGAAPDKMPFLVHGGCSGRLPRCRRSHRSCVPVL
jgi:hypothetical protein